MWINVTTICFILKSIVNDNNIYSPCRPDLIEFENLKRSNAHYNLQNAFNVSEKELGLTKLLDPEGGCINSAHAQNDKKKLGSFGCLTLTDCRGKKAAAACPKETNGC